MIENPIERFLCSLRGPANFVIFNCLFQGNSGGGIKCKGQGKVRNKTNFWNDLTKMLEAQNLRTENAVRPDFMTLTTSSEGIVSNCSFVENTAKAGGAIAALYVGLKLSFIVFENNFNSAVFLSGSPANFTLCTFHGNIAYDFGGAINTYRALLSVISCVFTENEVLGSDSGGGGAILFGKGTTLTVFNSTFHGNRGSMGGAISANGFQASLGESRFVGNSGFAGGAVELYSSYVVLEKCQFEWNSADGEGGALFIDLNSNVTMNQTHFVNNTATAGGAIFSKGNSSLFCNFSTFHNNSAKFK